MTDNDSVEEQNQNDSFWSNNNSYDNGYEDALEGCEPTSSSYDYSSGYDEACEDIESDSDMW